MNGIVPWFFLGRAIGESNGVRDPNGIGIIAALLKPPGGIIAASALASRERQSSGAAAVVSTGPQVEVPDVKGDTLTDATVHLEAVGLKVARQDVISELSAKDQVVRQSPDPQSTIPAGSTVTLGVSIGFKMPDVKGQQVAAANAQLTALGLSVTVDKNPDQSVVGTVINQNPSSGDFVSDGDAVELLVSEGPTTLKTR